MNQKPIVCEQAVFTSARGPTGQGYRIVAASKGLRPDEKQKITRCSPSHESLCLPADEAPMGVAFFSMPSGRLCVAVSRHAGAEQSGRGGQRVYTHNLIFPSEAFASCGYNPFQIVRAMPETLIDPQKLPAGGVLPTLEILLNAGQRPQFNTKSAALLPSDARLATLQYALDHKPVVVDLPEEWVNWAEALILALPAPLRAKTTFAAGMKYSAGRGHVLNLLRDDQKAIQNKATAQGLNFITATGSYKAMQSSWHSFVDRLWSSGNLSELGRRTSRLFEDSSPAARERIGELYNAIDSLPKIEILPIFELVFRTLNAGQHGVEAEIRQELRAAAQSEILRRFYGAAWIIMKPVWFRLVEFWRNGGDAAAFVQPIIQLALQSAAKADAPAAAELAMAVANVPPGVDREAHESMMTQVANRLAEAATAGSAEDAEKIQRFLARCRPARPTGPIANNAGAPSPYQSCR